MGKTQKLLFVPKNVPKIHIIQAVQKQYSSVKLFIPKGTDGKPSVEKGKYWYVYFRFRNPDTGQFDNHSKFIFKHDINRLKTVKERKIYGKNLVGVYTELLNEGWNPYTNEKPDAEMMPTNLTVKEGFLLALKNKKNEWAQNTYRDMNFRITGFLNWAKKQGVDRLQLYELKSRHVVMFLNKLSSNGESNTSINNYRACISAIIGKLVADGELETNVVRNIPKRKARPLKNKPFTPKQVMAIKEYLEETDQKLLFYLKFVTYAFLRNSEIVRLKIKDIDLVNDFFYVQSKTEARATVRIIPQLKQELEKRELSNYDPEDFLFTDTNTPGKWETTEKQRTDHYSFRFRPVKKKFDLGKEYGIYSFRHTFAVDLYNSFIKKGCTTVEAELKMLPITRHKSLSGLRNYLRDVGAMLPKDYGKDYTIDF